MWSNFLLIVLMTIIIGVVIQYLFSTFFPEKPPPCSKCALQMQTVWKDVKDIACENVMMMEE